LWEEVLSSQSKDQDSEEETSIGAAAGRVFIRVVAVYAFVWLMNKL
jgi:hypothetical protein